MQLPKGQWTAFLTFLAFGPHREASSCVRSDGDEDGDEDEGDYLPITLGA